LKRGELRFAGGLAMHHDLAELCGDRRSFLQDGRDVILRDRVDDTVRQYPDLERGHSPGHHACLTETVPRRETQNFDLSSLVLLQSRQHPGNQDEQRGRDDALFDQHIARCERRSFQHRGKRQPLIV
jgi:hypothetical protein